ncbi:class I SAM-dependent methyltransferase [Corynebacterium uterequi]|uniref:Methyltransferase family protein n=1 Tax=Corynebacterium uterequi TaxID=1072256 RepID=A0A0G3HE71_9CORY|nr:methyltransferase domain-containing protein [Corynebacterium uterequi]AKK11045.1 methyltransferase family protein [Corynebacterium uterequi]
MQTQNYRPPSAKHAPTFHDAAHRWHSAQAFAAGADVYDSVRPGYPKEVGDLVAGFRRVVDIGAGTGKLTTALRDRGHDVVAVDPSPDMTRVLSHVHGIPAWRATAEATALAAGSVDAATIAQTWHWVDVPAASRELHRVVRAGGRVVLVWNTLDVSHPWVLRLARIMHSGDIHAEGFVPDIAGPWAMVDERRLRWAQHLRAEDLFLLAQTRSYWLRSREAIRQRVSDNLAWYLYERLRFHPDQLLALPYRTDAFVLERVS